MTTGLIEAGGRTGVDLGRIEEELAGLWRQTEEERRRGTPVARVRVCNLVVYVEDEPALAAARRLADVLPSRHPCRLIIVSVGPHGGDRLKADVGARCSVGPGGRRQVCCEMIVIPVPPSARGFVPNVVLPLLVADLPVVVWWTPAPRPNDEIFRHLTDELADRVIVDTHRGDDAASLTALAGWAAAPHRHAMIGDLAWARTLPWRRVVAEFFDPPETRPLLRQLQGFDLMCAGCPVCADALLLTGWLASRLRWQLASATREGAGVGIEYRGGGGTVAVHLGCEEAQGRERLTAVRLSADTADDVFGFEAHRGGADVVHAHVLAPGRPEFDRAAPLLARSDEELVSDLLDPRLPDPVYEAALARAAEIAARLRTGDRS
jgi:glucose-6-phosphate dehydrogenase assembly protein OpcA